MIPQSEISAHLQKPYVGSLERTGAKKKSQLTEFSVEYFFPESFVSEIYNQNKIFVSEN